MTLYGNLTRKQTANHLAHADQVAEGRQPYIDYDYHYGRLTDIRYPFYPANDVHYEYGGDADKGLNQAGRIKQVSHQAGLEYREYGRLGELVREKKTITAATPGGGESHAPTYETLYDFDTFGRLMRIVLPDGETLLHDYDSGGSVTAIRGRFAGADYQYLNALYYDKFGQRNYMELGNGIKSRYTYDPANRRLCLLQSGKALNNAEAQCETFAKVNENGEVNAELKALVEQHRQSAPFGQFQNLHYAYDKVGDVHDVLMPREAGRRERPAMRRLEIGPKSKVQNRKSKIEVRWSWVDQRSTKIEDRTTTHEQRAVRCAVLQVKRSSGRTIAAASSSWRTRPTPGTAA